VTDLKDHGAGPEVFDRIHANSIKTDVLEGAECFIELSCDSIIGNGGGAALDVAWAVVLKIHHSGQKLLELPLNGYFFTGSYVTDKFIYDRVAKKMVPCQLELCGKDPLYVSENNLPRLMLGVPIGIVRTA